MTTVRAFDHDGPGLLAVERRDPASRERVLLVFNTAATELNRKVEVSYRAPGIAPLPGQGPAELAAPGAARIARPPFGLAACILEDGE